MLEALSSLPEAALLPSEPPAEDGLRLQVPLQGLPRGPEAPTMKRLTLQGIGDFVMDRPVLEPHRPSPMPGKRWPTRVAWHFEVGRYARLDDGTGKVKYGLKDRRTLSYLGKPTRYRALQVRKFLKGLGTAKSTQMCLISSWQAEFDRGGLIAYKIAGGGRDPHHAVLQAFFAYHPHSSEVDIVEAFAKPLFLKYVGGIRLYSQKHKLTQEAVDAYYEWYHTQFKRRLRRPKAVASAIVAGEPIESSENPL